MSLIRQLHELQEEHGFLSPELLHQFSEEQRVPLYRLQELVSFYPHFRSTAPPRVEVSVCRDMSCWLANSAAACAAIRQKATSDIEVHEVSCLGRCDNAPAAAMNGTPIPATRLAAADVATWPASAEEAAPAAPPRR